MSCSVIAIPWAIAWLVAGIPAVAISAAAKASFDDEGLELERYLEARNENFENNLVEPCGDVHVISEKQFLEKSFETPYMDKDLLLKTLEEHGVTNIKENEYGQIKGVSGNFVLTFERADETQPYSVLIKYLSTENVTEEIENLNNEYAVNVQEAAYMELIENLKNNNMEIESEEVGEDNTIVLTINLE